MGVFFYESCVVIHCVKSGMLLLHTHARVNCVWLDILLNLLRSFKYI